MFFLVNLFLFVRDFKGKKSFRLDHRARAAKMCVEDERLNALTHKLSSNNTIVLHVMAARSTIDFTHTRG
jgi:hypothetical protein